MQSLCKRPMTGFLCHRIVVVACFPALAAAQKREGMKVWPRADGHRRRVAETLPKFGFFFDFFLGRLGAVSECRLTT